MDEGYLGQDQGINVTLITEFHTEGEYCVMRSMGQAGGASFGIRGNTSKSRSQGGCGG